MGHGGFVFLTGQSRIYRSLLFNSINRCILQTLALIATSQLAGTARIVQAASGFGAQSSPPHGKCDRRDSGHGLGGYPVLS